VTPFAIVASIAVALCAVMALAWLVALRTGQSGWIDAIWSFAVGAAGVAAALLPVEGSQAFPERQYLVAGLAAAWSLRLGLHIVARTLRGGDDPRYAQLRREWGEDFPRRLFSFLQIQASAALLLVVAIFAAARNPSPALGFGDFLGLAIMVAAVLGEGLADRQLARFRADPANRGKVCDVGLWGYSRHPNYFFEWLSWLAYVAIAVDFGGGYPWGYAAIAAPLFMYWLLVHVSGIPPLEAHMLRSRPEAFRDYQARVNAFWPGPRRRAAQP
jgi:steroid 5-alpha reductase family enzyme